MSPESNRIRAEQLQLVLNQVESVVHGSAVLLVVFLAITWNSVPLLFTIVWGLTMTSILLWRKHSATRSLERLSSSENIADIALLLITQVALTGLMWGFGAFLMMQYSDVLQDILLVIGLLILTTGAIFYVGAYPLAYLLFLTAVIAPLIVSASLKYPDLIWIIALIGCAYIPTSISSALRFAKHALSNIELLAETSELSSELASVNEDLNNRLEIHRATELELKRNQSYLDAIFEYAPVEIYLKDPEGRYLRISRQYEKIYNLNNQDVVGKLPPEIHQGNLGELSREHDLQVLREKKPVIREMETHLPGINDGELHTMLTVKFPLFDNEQNALGIGAVVADITGQKRVQQQTRFHKERFEDFANHAADYFWELDQQLKYVFIAGTIDMLGKSESEILSHTQQEVFLGQVIPDDNWLDHIELMTQHQPYSLEFSLNASQSEGFRIFEMGWPRFDDDGQFQGYRGIGRDITREYLLKQDIVHQASHDPLTGVQNRRIFLKKLEQSLQQANQSNVETFFCFLDLNGFKQVNDTAGHSAGDEFLRTFSSLLVEKVESKDDVGRLGGDEFGLLLHETSRARVQSITDSIIRELEKTTFQWGTYEFSIGVSIGVVTISRTTMNVSSIMADADRACYRAKKLGMDRAVFN